MTEGKGFFSHTPTGNEMGTKAGWACAVALLLALGACGSSSSGGSIYFASDRDANFDIYAVDPRNGHVRNISNSPEDDHSPVVSPNRRSVAYVATSGNGQGVMVADRIGETKASVTQSQGRYRDPRWAPGSNRLAYLDEGSSEPRVYIVGADGGDQSLLTNISGDEVGGWSPDGETVVFAVHDGAGQGIYVRNPDGVNEFRLTEAPDRRPVWSPDSKQIAFLSKRDGNDEVYVMNADGSGVVRVTETPAPEYDLSWSPSGKQLVFVSEQDGNAEIYVAEVGNRKQTRLTFNQVRDEKPVWSPDGRQIAFVSYLDNDADLFVMNADGKGQVRLTNNDAEDTEPSW
ncbi:MAG: hypothetical protein FJ312_08130 [SAR202 cluster bacterium]|nr:hypothetical protein [SAR202 cluster bacterium]